MTRKPSGHWKTKANIDKELHEVINQIGHFPTYSELQKMANTKKHGTC